MSLLDNLISACGTPGATLPGLFLAGLLGSVLHCGPMCGPFVLGMTAERMARIPAVRLCEASRLRGALLLPYHVGRIATYAALGAAAAALGGRLLPPTVAPGLLAAAAVLFALQAMRRLAPGMAWVAPGLDRAPGWWVARIGRIAGVLDRSSWTGGLLLGLTLGLLPCGMVYAALLAAAAGGGALAMVAFGLGTVPMLVTIGLAGRAAGLRWHGLTVRLAPAVMLFNAGVLGMLAWQAARVAM